jgi:hypothetical protein
MSTSKRALVTFAFVSESLKTHNDVIVGLTPLFTPIAIDNAGKQFVPQLFSQELQSRYGISITEDIAEFISFRLHGVGLLRRVEAGSQDVLFYWNPPEVIGESSSRFEERLTELANLAIKFAAQNPTLMHWSLSINDALDMLFDWIIENDKELTSARLALDTFSNSSDVLSNRNGSGISSENDYFCSRFVTWLESEDKKAVSFLAEIGNALLVSEVVLELRSPSFDVMSGRNLMVYLDAPFCMDFLGTSGHSAQDNSRYIVSCLKQLGAVILIFEHSIREIKESISALLNNSPGNRRGPTANAILRQEITTDYLSGLARNPHQFILEAGIQIFDPDVTIIPPNQKAVFTEEHSNELFARLSPHFKRMEAAERDTLSTCIIMQRRIRHKSNNFFRSRHIMISDNTMIAHITRKFCEENRFIGPNDLGPIISTRQCAAILWLALGSQQREELSRQ